MRDIAKEAGISLGASYYYFKNKQELVLAFYADTQEAAETHYAETVQSSADFAEGLRGLFEYRLFLLEPYRSFLSVLTRHIDPRQAISPFSHETADLRKRAIRMIEGLLKTAQKQPSETIAHHLSVAIWFFQIGLVFFWLNDTSKGQQQTRRLLDIGQNLIQLVIRMSRLSIFRPINRTMKEMMEIVEGTFL